MQLGKALASQAQRPLGPVREHNSILPPNGRRIIRSTRGLSFVSLKASAPLITRSRVGTPQNRKDVSAQNSRSSPVCSSLHLGGEMSTAPVSSEFKTSGNSSWELRPTPSQSLQATDGRKLGSHLSPERPQRCSPRSYEVPAETQRKPPGSNSCVRNSRQDERVSPSPSQEVSAKPSPKHRIVVLPIPQSHVQEVLRVKEGREAEKKKGSRL